MYFLPVCWLFSIAGISQRTAGGIEGTVRLPVLCSTELASDKEDRKLIAVAAADPVSDKIAQDSG